MTLVNPAADLLDVYSSALGQMSEATVYSVIQNALASGAGINMTRDPGTGLVTISQAPLPRPVSVDGITILGDGTPAYPLRAVLTNNAITITPTIVPNGTISVAYSQTFAATGGISPYTWGFSGTLPPGVSLNTSSGVLSGTPTTAGNYNFTINVTDTNGRTGAISYNMSIAAATPTSFAVNYGAANEILGGGAQAIMHRVESGAVIDLAVSYALGFPTHNVLFGSMPSHTFPDGAQLIGLFAQTPADSNWNLTGAVPIIYVVIKGGAELYNGARYFSSVSYNTAAGGVRALVTSGPVGQDFTYSVQGDGQGNSIGIWRFGNATSIADRVAPSGSGTILFT